MKAILCLLSGEIILILWGVLMYRASEMAYYEELHKTTKSVAELSTDWETIDTVLDTIKTREDAIELRKKIDKIIKNKYSDNINKIL